MTVLLGPLPCVACGTIVAIVRRRFSFRCSAHGRLCTSECIEPSVVEMDGATHICAGMMVAEEASSKRRHWMTATADRVEGLTTLPGPCRISE